MAITRATNLASVGSGLGANPAQPIDIGSGIQMDGSSTGIITATTFSGTATNAGSATGLGIGATGYGLVLSGDLTAANVTVGGTLTYDDVTNVDSIGLITARNGLSLTGGNITLGVSGGATDDRIVLGSSPGYLQIYNSSAATSIIDGGSAQIINKTPDFQVQNAGGDLMLKAANASSVDLYFNASKKFETTGLGVTVFGKTQTQTLNVSGVSTFTGVGFTGFLREGINIVSGKLSDNTTINIDHSMAHYFTTTETTTAIPNFTSTAGINTDLSVGETFSVNVITTAATAGYSTGAKIDAGSTLSVLWNGGDDPSEGGSDGVDVYTYQVIKTGDATFTVLGNVSNFA
jgi:hypothetical protein